MSTPRLSIRLDRIEHNARVISGLCRERGMSVAGVTKCVCGHPEVARAMQRGGVAQVADSRLDNIRRMREAGVEPPFMLLRLPALSAVDEVVRWADVSLNSEVAVLRALSRAAQRQGREHGVVIMVELGDLREGAPEAAVLDTAQLAAGLPGIRVRGLGTNLGCLAGVVTGEAHMRRLVGLAEEIRERLGLRLDIVSGINSGGLELLATGAVPAAVNHARIGEAILLGRESTHRHPWPGTRRDAFELAAEVLELQRKRSGPRGERGEDAFGHVPELEDRGEVLHALVNLGRQDVDAGGISPLDRGVRLLGASSDYLALDVSALAGGLRVGDEIRFAPNYSALLRAMTSGYVYKDMVQGECRQ